MRFSLPCHFIFVYKQKFDMASRPEYSGPPELYYNDVEATKYTNNSRVMEIQVQMCERAIELLLLPENRKCLLLDIGCGSGLSGNVLEENGHHWIGVDISAAMLKVAVDREVKGDLLLSDMGQGMPFKAGCFDGAVSISALQWICNVDKNTHVLYKRLGVFFSTLFASLSSNARAVFQFYPESEEQIHIITTAATKAGFYGGTIVDYPNSKKARKFFLVLMNTSSSLLPSGLDNSQDANQQIKFERKQPGYKSKTPSKSKKRWIMEKKEKRRRQGKSVKSDSKYSGRKRNN